MRLKQTLHQFLACLLSAQLVFPGMAFASPPTQQQAGEQMTPSSIPVGQSNNFQSNAENKVSQQQGLVDFQNPTSTGNALAKTYQTSDGSDIVFNGERVDKVVKDGKETKYTYVENQNGELTNIITEDEETVRHYTAGGQLEKSVSKQNGDVQYFSKGELTRIDHADGGKTYFKQEQSIAGPYTARDHYVDNKGNLYYFDSSNKLSQLIENKDDTQSGINLASQAKAQASSSLGAAYSAANATNGIYGDQKDYGWLASGSEKEWLVLDFGSEKSVNRIQYDTRYNLANTNKIWQESFTISGSLDGENWFALAQATGQDHAQLYEFTIDPKTVRYVKVHDIVSKKAGNANPYSVYVQEIGVYEVPAKVQTKYSYQYDAAGKISGITTEQENKNASHTNLASQAKTQTSSSLGAAYSAANATNGIYGDRQDYGWLAGGSEKEWLLLDFGSEKSVNRIQYDTRYNLANTNKIWQEAFTISGSTDGENWFTLAQVTGQDHAQLYEFTIDPKSVRYVKVHDIVSKKTGSSTPYSAYVQEIGVYEVAAKVQMKYSYQYDAAGKVSEITTEQENKTPSNANLASQAKAQTSSSLGAAYSAANATNGVYGDRQDYGWLAGGSEKEWLTLDFGSEKSVNRIQYDTRYNLANTDKIWQEAFTISGSVDGENWFTLAQVTAQDHAQLYEFMIDPKSVRYVKVHDIVSKKAGNSNRYFVYVQEIGVYEGTSSPTSQQGREVLDKKVADEVVNVSDVKSEEKGIVKTTVEDGVANLNTHYADGSVENENRVNDSTNTLIQVTKYSKDGTKRETRFYEESTNKLVRLETRNADGTLLSIRTYDSNGRSTAYTAYRQDGSVDYVYDYSTEFPEKLSKATYYTESGVLKNIHEFNPQTGKSTKITLFFLDGKTSYIRVYDKNGNNATLTVFRQDGSIDYRYDYSAEFPNKLDKATYYYENNALKNIHEFNAETAKSVKITSFFLDGNTSSIRIYDNQGNNATYTSFRQDGSVEYTYDYSAEFPNKLDKATYYYENGALKSIHEFDPETGKTSKITSFFLDGTMSSIRIYDNQGNNATFTSFRQDGSVDYVYDYSTTFPNKLTKATYYYENNALKTIHEFNPETGKSAKIEKYYLNGAVSETSFYDQAGNRVSLQSFSFDGPMTASQEKTEYGNNGKRSSVTRYRKDGSIEQIRIYSPDDPNKLIKITHFYENSTTVRSEQDLSVPSSKITFEKRFDVKGKLTEEITYDSNASIAKQVRYYQNGTMNFVRTYKADGSSHSTVYYLTGVISNERDYNAKNQLVLESVFGSDGKLTEKINYDSGVATSRVRYHQNGSTESIRTYTSGIVTHAVFYYENGTTVRSEQNLNASSGKLEFEKKFGIDGKLASEVTYDSNARLAKSVLYNQDGTTNTVRTYEADGSSRSTIYYLTGVVYKKQNYNTENRLVFEEVSGTNGKLTEKITYDSAGIMTLRIRYYQSGQVESVRTERPGQGYDIRYFQTDGILTRITVYDAAGKLSQDIKDPAALRSFLKSEAA